MAAESGDHRRFCGSENRSLHDAEEPRKISVPFSLHIQSGCCLRGEARSHAIPDAGWNRCLYTADSIKVSRMTSAPSSDCSNNSRFVSKTIVTASSRFARLFKSSPLCVGAKQFFDERDIAFGRFHVYSRQFHLRHTLQSYQDTAARAARDLSHAPVWCIMV